MKIFFSAPFTPLHNPITGFSGTHRDLFESIVRTLEDAKHDVYSAHFIEEWGEALREPNILALEDFNAVRDCDLVIAFLGELMSQGVLIELGWASAFRRPIILITQTSVEYSPMIQGLSSLTNIRNVPFSSGHGIQKLLNTIKDYLQQV